MTKTTIKNSKAKKTTDYKYYNPLFCYCLSIKHDLMLEINQQ